MCCHFSTDNVLPCAPSLTRQAILNSTMPDSNCFADRHAVITGASRGIGRSLALRLARAGARLSLCGRDEAALEEVHAAAKAAGAADVATSAFDVRDAAAIVSFCADAMERFGTIDALVNNAGFNPRKALLHEVEIEEFDDIVSVNLRAPFVFVKELLPGMLARGTGHVISVLSTVCCHDNETMGAYTAAKKGFEGLTGVLLKEARAKGVRVSAIYPGGTNTAFRPAERPDYMSPDSVADAIYSVLTLPEDLIVQSMTFRPMVETNF